jgi:AmiR/NasT family two-component response regulator
MTGAGRARAGLRKVFVHSRSAIDQAMGIVMAESRCDADQAFATLTRASNNRNLKLRGLATEIVTRVGGRPPSHPAE